MTKPPRLTAIRTRGASNQLLTAIQLVFEDGHESPLFDTKRGGSIEIKTVELTGKAINKIIWQGDRDTVRFWFEHEGGRQLIFDEAYLHQYSPETREIQPNHYIVGIKGRIELNNHFKYLGFIVAEY